MEATLDDLLGCEKLRLGQSSGRAEEAWGTKRLILLIVTGRIKPDHVDSRINPSLPSLTRANVTGVAFSELHRSVEVCKRHGTHGHEQAKARWWTARRSVTCLSNLLMLNAAVRVTRSPAHDPIPRTTLRMMNSLRGD